jgi:hypothetical protein
MANRCLRTCTKYKRSASNSSWDMYDPPRFYDLYLLYTWKVGHTDLNFCQILYKPNINVRGQIVLEIWPTKILWPWPTLHLKSRSHRPGFLSTSIDGQQVFTYQMGVLPKGIITSSFSHIAPAVTKRAPLTDDDDNGRRTPRHGFSHTINVQNSV